MIGWIILPGSPPSLHFRTRNTWFWSWSRAAFPVAALARRKRRKFTRPSKRWKLSVSNAWPRSKMYEEVLVQKEPKSDWLMLASIVGLMLLGLAFIFSASTVSDANSRFWIKQAIAYGLGIVLAAGVCCVRYDTLSRFATIGYWLSIFLLLCVMAFGTSRMGAKRWLDLGFFQFQPSEFAKLAFIFMQASFLSRPKEELRDPKLFMKALAMTALPFID